MKLRSKMKLGCLDYTFSYMSMPSRISLLSKGVFLILNKTNLIKNHRYIERAIEKISELGFQGIQVMCQSVKQMPISASKLEKLCRNANLEIASLGGYIDFLSTKWEPERFISIIDYANDVGTKIVCTHSGTPKEIDNWAIFTKRLSDMLDYAKSHNIKIAVENIPKSLIRRYDDFIRLKKMVKNVYINFDPANLNLVGGDVVSPVMKLKGKIIQTHAKDFINIDGRWKFVPVGDGDMPYSTYLRVLKKIGFRGYLIVEYEGFGNPLIAVKKSKEYLENIL